MLGMIRGGMYGKPGSRKVRRRASARETMDLLVQFERDMRAAYGAMYGEDGNVPSKGIYSIRDGSQHPWRVSMRRAVEANETGVPIEHVVEPFRVAERYAREHRALIEGQDSNPNKAA